MIKCIFIRGEEVGRHDWSTDELCRYLNELKKDNRLEYLSFWEHRFEDRKQFDCYVKGLEDGGCSDDYTFLYADSDAPDFKEHRASCRLAASILWSTIYVVTKESGNPDIPDTYKHTVLLDTDDKQEALDFAKGQAESPDRQDDGTICVLAVTSEDGCLELSALQDADILWTDKKEQ